LESNFTKSSEWAVNRLPIFVIGWDLESNVFPGTAPLGPGQVCEAP